MRTAERPPTFEYLREVVQTAEDHGFHSLLIPTRFVNGLFAEEAPLAETWTMATALAAVTSRIRFLIAVRPGFVAAGLFAKMVATLDQISHGRVDINIVPGGIQNDFERLGVDIDHAGRYEQAEELMQACKALWTGQVVDFQGTYITLRGPAAPRPRWAHRVSIKAAPRHGQKRWRRGWLRSTYCGSNLRTALRRVSSGSRHSIRPVATRRCLVCVPT